ncbi:MAG: hypothetical protein EAX81_04095 [Candidatus Thorarchaeota archaeon]|nr:hypothetical protein [Candidatus Thorarchaeota archaeon]
MLPTNIRKRIRSDYGPERANAVEASLEDFENHFVDLYKVEPSPRIFRCLLHLTVGDEASLARHSEIALSDWRDVILWTEYDKNENRVVMEIGLSEP